MPQETEHPTSNIHFNTVLLCRKFIHGGKSEILCERFQTWKLLLDPILDTVRSQHLCRPTWAMVDFSQQALLWMTTVLHVGGSSVDGKLILLHNVDGNPVFCYIVPANRFGPRNCLISSTYYCPPTMPGLSLYAPAVMVEFTHSHYLTGQSGRVLLYYNTYMKKITPLFLILAHGHLSFTYTACNA
jgi:hypothetical protein